MKACVYFILSPGFREVFTPLDLSDTVATGLVRLFKVTFGKMKDCPHNFIKRNYYSLSHKPQIIPENRIKNIPITGNDLLGILEQEREGRNDVSYYNFKFLKIIF